MNQPANRRIAAEANRRAVATREALTGRELTFDEHKVIVSKTDIQGRITYANETFLEVSGFSEEELIGAPHSILRHPDMPRCVFRFLWDNISDGREVFAYVLNRAKNGDAYWVFAHVTPTFGADRSIIAYHSNRRKPSLESIAKVRPIYRALLDAEKTAGPRDAVDAGLALLTSTIQSTGMSYEELVFTF